MNKQKSWREKINDIMENYRLYEEGSGSANWDDKYTKQIVKVVGQAISSERQRLIEEVRAVVEGMRLETHETEALRKQLYGYNQALDDLLQELNKLKGINE